MEFNSKSQTNNSRISGLDSRLETFRVVGGGGIFTDRKALWPPFLRWTKMGVNLALVCA